MKRTPLLLLIPLLFLSGCGSGGDFIMVLPIAGGGKVQVPLGPGGPKLADTDEARVMAATFSVPPNKKAVLYLFALQFKTKEAPERIVIDDVSEDPVVTLVDQKGSIVLGKENEWRAAHEMAPKTLDDIAWLNYEGNTMRVYRFTLYWKDGHRSEIMQATPVPPFVKEFLKYELGFKKKPGT